MEHVYLGCHLSSSKGFLHMGKEAVSIGADTFQFFTRNPRGSRAKEIKEIVSGVRERARDRNDRGARSLYAESVFGG